MFRRNHVFYWANKTLDQAVAHYAHTRACCASSLLPAGNAAEEDKAIHHLLLHVLQYMAGWDYVWGPGPGPRDRVLSASALLPVAKRNLMACDVVAIYPEYSRQLLPQLEFHLPWIPRDAKAFLETHFERKRPSGHPPSAPSPATLALLKCAAPAGQPGHATNSAAATASG